MSFQDARNICLSSKTGARARGNTRSCHVGMAERIGLNQTTRFCNHMACQLWYLWIAVPLAEPFRDETKSESTFITSSPRLLKEKSFSNVPRLWP
jgi:hypothetical protein